MRKSVTFLTHILCLFLIVMSTASVGANYEEIEWTELMPDSDLAALMDPPEFLSQVQDGSELDSADAFSQQDFNDERVQRFQEALNSTNVIKAFDKRAIRIPGFIVPLQQNEERKITEFFVVPYFGACIHMPPPPPNQIIFVQFEQGIELDDLQQAFWFEGIVDIQTQEHQLGTSAYALQLDNYELYE